MRNDRIPHRYRREDIGPSPVSSPIGRNLRNLCTLSVLAVRHRSRILVLGSIRLPRGEADEALTVYDSWCRLLAAFVLRLRLVGNARA
jgi:hypothetical protein